MIGALVFLLLLAVPAPLWIAVGVRIQAGRQERLDDLNEEIRERKGIRLHSIRIRR